MRRVRGKHPKLLSDHATEYEWNEKYQWHPGTGSVTRSVSNLKKSGLVSSPRDKIFWALWNIKIDENAEKVCSVTSYYKILHDRYNIILGTRRKIHLLPLWPTPLHCIRISHEWRALYISTVFNYTLSMVWIYKTNISSK